MKSWAVGAVALVLLASLGAEAGAVRLVVIDLPTARVWAAAVRAMEGYPVLRAAEGLIVTGRLERTPRPDEGVAERVAERITVRVEPFEALSTRVTIEVEAWALRGGAWVPVPSTETTARGIAARLRAEQG